ncbi:MAG: hypothetical protein M5U24_08600 [Candidatus Kuenenia sp.]|uniref:hypothetical protein n=1 Tax=Candidatus Kuenenia sp. TaxID=2499824 RepID=UPI0022BB2D00|nr:hypothetical protein [Candidatus Kuenenia sp.]MCZ7622530.1 hypothetical protein [Candidatus Kuenenia sp.]
MAVSDELYDMIKFFEINRHQEMRKENLYNPANLWCMWIRKDLQTWKKFVVWYLQDSLEILEKNGGNFWDYFTSHKNNIQEFANEWVVDEERNSFYRFCINKMKNNDLSSKTYRYKHHSLDQKDFNHEAPLAYEESMQKL